MVDWDFALCIVTHSYNITPHTLLGECPFYLFSRRDPNIPGLHNIISHNIRYYGDNSALHLIDVMQIMYQDIRDFMIKMQVQSPLDPSKITGHVYEVGDMVLQRNTPEAKALLGSKYSPCYRIITLSMRKS